MSAFTVDMPFTFIYHICKNKYVFSDDGTACEMHGSEYRCVMSADECGSNQSAESSTDPSLACCSSDLFPYCCVPQN